MINAVRRNLPIICGVARVVLMALSLSVHWSIFRIGSSMCELVGWAFVWGTAQSCITVFEVQVNPGEAGAEHLTLRQLFVNLLLAAALLVAYFVATTRGSSQRDGISSLRIDGYVAAIFGFYAITLFLWSVITRQYRRRRGQIGRR